MKKWNRFLQQRWVANSLTVCVGVILYVLLNYFNVLTSKIQWVFGMLSPIIIGIVIAYLIDPFVKWFEKRVFFKIPKENTRRVLSVIVTVILVVLFVILFFVALVPPLIKSLGDLYTNKDKYIKTLENLLEQYNPMGIGNKLKQSSLTKHLEELSIKALAYLADNSSTILNASKSIGTSLFNIVIGFILGVYFLLGKKGMLSGINELRHAIMGEQKATSHDHFWRRCHEVLIQYIGCNLLDGLIVGVVNAIIMVILQMPDPALISVVVGTTNLLPTFGPIIGGAIGALLLCLKDPRYALWFLIFTIIIQTIDGYILKPRLFSGSLGISALWTLISILIGGNLFGVVGIFLAVPMMAILTSSYKETFLPWLKKKTQARAKEKELEAAEERKRQHTEESDNPQTIE